MNLRKHLTRRRLGGLVLWLVLGLVLWGCFSTADALGRHYPARSLRYSGAPLSGQQAEALRRHAVESAETESDAWWPSFWAETTARLETELAETESTCLYYSGDGALVWPAEFLAGGWPGATDTRGCVLSRALAFRLWGSGQVVGKTLKLGEETYTVRGVFAGDEALALAACGERESPVGWQAVELPTGADATGEEALAFATAGGLPQPESMIQGVYGLGRLAALAPVLVLLVAALLGAGRAAVRGLGLPGGAVLFAAALALALLLPALLELLPGWLVPSRWSDFGFWGGQLTQAGEALRGFFGAVPHSRDVDGKLLLLRQGVLLALGLPLAATLVRREMRYA